jgi:uncharacterized membrane protein (UPF0127 family)
MSPVLPVFIAALRTLLIVWAFVHPPSPVTLMIGGEALLVERAATPESRERGLSGRNRIDYNRGMLFVFPEDGLHPMWMKDMRVPIDMVWLNREGYVVAMRQNVFPESYPQTFSSPVPARYVLELAAFATDYYGIAMGTRIVLP